jgi:hypothetical protein
MGLLHYLYLFSNLPSKIPCDFNKPPVYIGSGESKEMVKPDGLKGIGSPR